MQYELFYLIGERQEANMDMIRENVKNILVSHQATLIEPELSEKRKLSYEIKHQKKGTYITRRFELPGVDDLDGKEKKESPIEEITKKLNLSNDVLRFLIVKTDDLPELGTKEKRKAQEIGAQKSPKSQRPVEKRQTNAYQQPRKPEQPKTEQPKPVVKETKEEVKDIDKQLDKLLDI